MRGLYSQNHSAKEGFFLAGVALIQKFKHLMDIEKFMKHVFSETKVPTGMKQGEAHAMLIGKFMAVSVLVQGCAHIVGSDVNTRVLSVLLGCLVDIFK